MARRPTAACPHRREGFTLIELLVVVLILAVLMAVSIPLYLSAVTDSGKKTCRANLQTIANAVYSARVKNASRDYSAYVGSVSTSQEPDLLWIPLCPNGGAYTISNGSSGDANTFQVNCSVGVHGKYEPGVDNY